MLKTYAMIRLLEHGPMTYRELVEVTGWNPSSVNDVVRSLMARGNVKVMHRKGGNRRLYILA